MRPDEFKSALASMLVDRGVPQNVASEQVTKLFDSLSGDSKRIVDGCSSDKAIVPIADALAVKLLRARPSDGAESGSADGAGAYAGDDAYGDDDTYGDGDVDPYDIKGAFDTAGYYASDAEFYAGGGFVVDSGSGSPTDPIDAVFEDDDFGDLPEAGELVAPSEAEFTAASAEPVVEEKPMDTRLTRKAPKSFSSTASIIADNSPTVNISDLDAPTTQVPVVRAGQPGSAAHPQGSPSRGSAAPHENVPARGNTPPHENVPARGNIPPHENAPARGNIPPHENVPARNNTQQHENAPARNNTQQHENAPAGQGGAASPRQENARRGSSARGSVGRDGVTAAPTARPDHGAAPTDRWRDGGIYDSRILPPFDPQRDAPDDIDEYAPDEATLSRLGVSVGSFSSDAIDERGKPKRELLALPPLPQLRETEEGRRSFITAAICLSPVIAVLAAVYFGLWGAVFAVEAAMIGALIIALVAAAAGGAFVSLAGIIYGIVKLPAQHSEGIFEIGLGVAAAGATLLCGVLIYNLALRFMPWAIKKTARLCRFATRKMHILILNVRGRFSEK